MEPRERWAHVVMRPSAYGLTKFDQTATFLYGFNVALDFEFLDRFNDWLAEELGGRHNLGWPSNAYMVISRRLEAAGRSIDELDQEEQMRALFTLVNEFLELRDRGAANPLTPYEYYARKWAAGSTGGGADDIRSSEADKA
ncbi:hypothetical protein [Amycolatopsis taiwanensis]|uniref:hypothetical protein n=1 Tax=Amycolatopsis taiwanensis TaxID=342230 RepID=UPI0012EC9D0F|nr:hypothetical protein [Amycolatopsis taiwanensis]